MKWAIMDLSKAWSAETVPVLKRNPIFGNRFRTYGKWQEELRSLGAAALLFSLVKDLTGLEELPEIGADAKGKPCFLHRRDLYFNLSHSGFYVACGVGSAPLGVDIQEYRGWKPEVAKRCFNEEEMARLSGFHTEKEREQVFYQYWSLKESVLKREGIGISGNWKGISFRELPGEKSFPEKEKPEFQYQVFLEGAPFGFAAALDLEVPYSAALCVNEPTLPDPERYVLLATGDVRRVSGCSVEEPC